MNEEQARKILGDAIRLDGVSLYSLGWFLRWDPEYDRAVLDGDFTAEQLEAIAWWMRFKGEGVTKP